MTWPADLEAASTSQAQASLALGWEEPTQVEPPAPSCLLRLEEGSHNPRLLPACHVGGSCSWGHNYYLTSTGSGCSPSPTPNPTFGQRREIYAFMAGLALRWPCTQVK